MNLSSPAFETNSIIPVKYTCKGPNISPPLKFDGIPPDAKSLVLTVEDIDAKPKPWIHWFVFNIPPTTTKVLEGKIPTGGTEGYANGGTFGYEGPCPMYFTGIHHYRFCLYALDSVPPIPATSSKYDIDPLIKNHTITQAELLGLAEGDNASR